MIMKGLRKMFTLQVEPTSACNLNCQICMRTNLKREIKFLSISNFKRLVDKGGFSHIALHGWGEPLLNKQLFAMVRYAESRGIATNLTTNGTLIQENIDEVFGSGLREIAFGVYDKEFFRRGIPSIEIMLKERNKKGYKTPKTYIDLTIYRNNYAQILDLVELAYELRVDAIILHRLFNVHSVSPTVEYISADEEKELFTRVRQLARALKLELYLPPGHSYPCRITKYSVFVNVEGELTPCCFLPELSLGNACERGIKKIMHSRAYRSFLQNMRHHPVCSRCRW
jgi:MoaA/NifB/PqqE/SkfB family radical SAM enzyme